MSRDREMLSLGVRRAFFASPGVQNCQDGRENTRIPQNSVDAAVRAPGFAWTDAHFPASGAHNT